MISNSYILSIGSTCNFGKKVLLNNFRSQFGGLGRMVINNQIVSAGYDWYRILYLPSCRLTGRLIRAIFARTSSPPKSVKVEKDCFQGEIALS